MEHSVFRSSSIERVSSPEQLNDYIKISKPSIWMVLIAAIVFLAGVVIWGIFGTLTTSLEAVGVVHNGDMICYVSADDIGKLKEGMEVLIGDNAGMVYAVPKSSPIQIDQSFDAYTMYLGGFEAGDFVCPVQVRISASEGIYPVKIITEKLSPISFILN